MAQRIDALVNVNMSYEEVAEFLDLPLEAVVQYGNGYAVVDAPKAPAPKPKRTPKPKKEEPSTAPEAAADEAAAE